MIDEKNLRREAGRAFEAIAFDYFSAFGENNFEDAYEPTVLQMQESRNDLIKTYALNAFDPSWENREAFREIVKSEIRKYF